jgi:hypothetical protein
VTVRCTDAIGYIFIFNIVNHFPRIPVEERFPCGNVDDGKLNATNVGTNHDDVIHHVDFPNAFKEG